MSQSIGRRRGSASIRFRSVILFALLIMFAVRVGQNPCQGLTASDPDSLWIDMVLELDDPNAGSLKVTVSTDPEAELEISDFGRPEGLGSQDNDNLDRVMRILDGRFDDPGQLFRSFLETEGEINLSGIMFWKSASPGSYAFSLHCTFDAEGNERTREFFLLPFLRSINVPPLNPNDPVSMVHRESTMRELELARVHIRIESDSPMNMDFQKETGGHVRSIGSESYQWKTNVREFRESGNGAMVTSGLIFQPSTMFMATIVLFSIFSVCLVLIWLRNRFTGVGLVLPILTAMVLALPFLFYFNPGMNVYGTFDSFLIGSWIMDILFLVGCFFINPRLKKRKLRTYEESKGPSFELPRVLYMERPVYIRSPESGGIDPYDVLGVTRSQSTDEIETAYKREILKYHPDKYHGLPDNVVDLSRRETERLNQAFEAIKRERNV